MALLLLMLLGLVATLLVFPDVGDLAAAERGVLAALYGLAISVAIATVLVRLPAPPTSEPAASGLLTRRALGVAVALTCIALGSAAGWRGAQPGAVLRQARRSLSRPGAWFVLAASALYTTSFGVLYSELPRRTTPVSWYYLRDILGVVDQAGLPTRMIDYGTAMPFDVNKLAWYLVVANTSLLSGVRNPFAIESFWVLAVAALLPVVAWVFLRSLTSTRLAAALGTTLMLCLPWLLRKMAAFRGESFGIVLLFSVLWLAVEASRRRDARWSLSAGLALGLLLGSHLVPGLVALAFSAAWWTGHALLERRSLGQTLRSGATVAATGLAFALLLTVGSGHGMARNQSGLSTPGAFSAYRGHDPARAFERLAYGRAIDDSVLVYRPHGDAAFFSPPSEVGRALLAAVDIPSTFDLAVTPAVLGIAFAAVSTLIFVFQRRSRELALALPLTLLILYAFALLLSLRFDTYLPAAHAVRREFPYVPLLLIVAIAAALDPLFAWIGGRLAPRSALAVGGALVVVLCAGPVRDAPDHLARHWARKRAVTPAGREALRWLTRHTGPDARILVDGSSDGLIRVLAGRTSLTEGRAPYFHAEALRTATDALAAAIGFFEAPEASWLRRHDVDYVMTGSQELATRPFARDGRRIDLDGLEGLRERVRYGDVAIYEVSAPRTLENDVVDDP